MARPAKPQDESTYLGRVGATIRRRREQKHLTVAEASKLADVPAPTWYHWESGGNLSLDRLPAIAAALGCKKRDLIPE